MEIDNELRHYLEQLTANKKQIIAIYQQVAVTQAARNEQMHRIQLQIEKIETLLSRRTPDKDRDVEIRN